MVRFKMASLTFILCLVYVIQAEAFWLFSGSDQKVDTKLTVLIPLESRVKRQRMRAEMMAISQTVTKLKNDLVSSCDNSGITLESLSTLPTFKSQVLENGPFQEEEELFFKRTTLITHQEFNLLVQKICH